MKHTMRQTIKQILLSVTGGLLLAAGASPQVIVDEIVARVNSDIILRSDIEEQGRVLRRELERQPALAADFEAVMAEESRHLLRNLIDESLMVQKAGEYGIESEADIEVLRAMDQIRRENGFESDDALEAAIYQQGDSPESIRESIRNQYLIQQVINNEVRSRIILTTEELRAYYDAHPEEFDRPRGVNLAEIAKVVEGRTSIEAAEIRAGMEAILERVRSGEDFFEVAEAESESTSARDGGILGYFGDGMLGPEFEQAATQLRRNEVSDVFEVNGALVIIKLLERHEGGILSFELARSVLENILRNEKEDPLVRDFLSRLRRDGYVWVREGYFDTGAGESDPGGAVE